MAAPVPEYAAPARRSSVWWPYMRDFLAGSFAGVGLVIAGHPFDTIKVRLQNEGATGRFKGAIDCLVKTVQQEKVRGLYKGAMGPLLGQGAVSSIQFGVFGLIRPYFSTPGADRQTLQQVWATGLLTGMCMFVPVTPMEGVKARMQMQYSEQHTGTVARYKSTPHCYATVFREKGMRGLYHGGIATVFSRLGFAWYISGYEACRRTLAQDHGKLSPVATMSAGAFAGTLHWLSTYPFDVVKNRMQGNPDKYPTFTGTIKYVFRTEGYRGFARGLSVCLFRSLPANSTTFLFLELARTWLPPA
eukprot:TRINITY_DN10587_c0_g1_i1.p1 TRINITY_DN10587_c0_g1~~TRINITY_DN10587_c0_g1_i1.p1  ORF type:complete len:302 (-),score=39.84 TRINITY_DN10587_c0_g1_i1:131-1036(-)